MLSLALMAPAALGLLGCGLDPAPVDTGPDTAPPPPCEVAAFANQALIWTLPADSQGSLRLPVDPDPGGNNWGLLDLGQGLSLVYTEPAHAEGGWSVHDNSGAGFALDPTPFPVPGPLASSLGQLENLDGEDLDWRLLDLSGDGQQDLVVTQLPGSSELGQSYWLVYPRAEQGFSDSAFLYNLPLAIRGASFHLGDWQGDGWPDLWIATEGGWEIHPGQAGSFASNGVSVQAPGVGGTLQDLDGDGWLDWFGEAGISFGGPQSFSPPEPLVLPDTATLMPIDEDRLALIDPAHSDTAWQRYSLELDTLGEPTALVHLPEGYPAGSFPAPEATTGRIWYALHDLTADGALDLVVTRIEGQDAIGLEHWRVHPGICAR